MSPELKKAIIKHVPEYFSRDQLHQEQYRVSTPEEDEFKIRQFLLRELFNISVSDGDALKAAWREMSEAQCLILNAALFPIQGIGEDFFYLNEFFSSQKNMLSFDTLYDYDSDDYEFQEDFQKNELKDYDKKTYRGLLYSRWARLVVDGSFSYAVLSMVAGYLHCQLDEYGQDYIEKSILLNSFRRKSNARDLTAAGKPS